MGWRHPGLGDSTGSRRSEMSCFYGTERKGYLLLVQLAYREGLV